MRSAPTSKVPDFRDRVDQEETNNGAALISPNLKDPSHNFGRPRPLESGFSSLAQQCYILSIDGIRIIPGPGACKQHVYR